MFKPANPVVAIAVATLMTTSAVAQSGAPAPAPRTSSGGLGSLGDSLGGLGGGLGGLLGGGASGIGSIGAGNAAGLLGYCLKNNLLGQGGALGALTGRQTAPQSRTQAPATGQAAGAQSILQRLTGRQGVRTSPGFAAGQAGELQAPNGQGLSLDNLGGQVKTKMCSLVLNRAKAFL
ncbi:DUF2501 domain-containing protein [Sphingomonas aerolata]|uniref:DUF2501 domain-containing protein n=1 Tax=Sphingomonas aerolata TaxID=185951 RepID=UPI00334A94C7